MSTLLDYCAAIDRLNAAIDHVLADGQAAQNRYDQFCQRHHIQPGSGARALTADTLPADQRYHHQGLLALWEKLYAEQATASVPRPDTLDASSSAQTAATAPRALANRTRI